MAGCCWAVQLRRRLRPGRASRPPGRPSTRPATNTLLSCRKSNADEAKTGSPVRGYSIALGDEFHPEHRRPELPRDQELVGFGDRVNSVEHVGLRAVGGAQA